MATVTNATINYPGADYAQAMVEGARDERWTEAERHALDALANRDPQLGQHHEWNKPRSPYYKKDAGSGRIMGFGKCRFLFHLSVNGCNVTRVD